MHSAGQGEVTQDIAIVSDKLSGVAYFSVANKYIEKIHFKTAESRMDSTIFPNAEIKSCFPFILYIPCSVMYYIFPSRAVEFD